MALGGKSLFSMKYEDKRTLVVSILMILLLGFFSYRNFTNLEVPQVPTQIAEIPIIEMPPVEELLPPEIANLLGEPGLEEEKKEEITQWTYLSHTIPQVTNFKYPSHWLASPPETAGEYAEIMNVLFFARCPNILNPAVVVISKMNINLLAEGLESLKKIFEGNNTKMEILEKEETEKGLLFSARYEHGEGHRVISREKIFAVNNNFYLFSIIVSEERFTTLSSQIEYIINSIQIIE